MDLRKYQNYGKQQHILKVNFLSFECGKEYKKMYNDMVNSARCKHSKFMSVYRFKAPDDRYSTGMHYYKRELSPVVEGLMQGSNI